MLKVIQRVQASMPNFLPNLSLLVIALAGVLVITHLGQDIIIMLDSIEYQYDRFNTLLNAWQRVGITLTFLGAVFLGQAILTER